MCKLQAGQSGLGNLVVLDMRAPILTFVFIISEYCIVTGEDGNCEDPPEIKNAEKVKNDTLSRFRMPCKKGYLRKAGTSDLFRCIKQESKEVWYNQPPLECIPDPTLKVTTPSPIPSSSATPSSSHTQPNTSSKTSGQTVLTTTHTVSTTTWTSQRTSQRNTAMEDTSGTTSITSRITTSSPTKKESLVTMSSHAPIRSSTTSTDKKGITAGVIIVVIIVGATALAILLWRRRSRLRRANDHSVKMTIQNPAANNPLINSHSITGSCPPGSIQTPVTPFKDSSETAYTDDPLSA